VWVLDDEKEEGGTKEKNGAEKAASWLVGC
jgi:hypothetical protein